MGISAGRLRSRIDLVRLVQVDNGKGGYTDSWAPIATNIAAEIIGLQGTEAVREKVLRGVQVYQITTRYRDDLQLKDQLRFNGQDFNIRSAVDPIGRRDRLVMIVDNDALPAS